MQQTNFTYSKFSNLFTPISIAFFCLILYHLSLFVLTKTCNLSYLDTLQNYRCPNENNAFVLPILASTLFSGLVAWFTILRNPGNKISKVMKACMYYGLFYFLTLSVTSVYPANIYGYDLEPIGTLFIYPILSVFLVAILTWILSLIPFKNSTPWLGKPLLSLVLLVSLGFVWFKAYAAITNVKSNVESLKQEAQNNFCEFVDNINLKADLKVKNLYFDGSKINGVFTFESTKEGRYIFSPFTTVRFSEIGKVAGFQNNIEKKLSIGTHTIPFELEFNNVGIGRDGIINDPPTSILDQKVTLKIRTSYKLENTEFNELYPDDYDKYGYVEQQAGTNLTYFDNSYTCNSSDKKLWDQEFWEQVELSNL